MSLVGSRYGFIRLSRWCLSVAANRNELEVVPMGTEVIYHFTSCDSMSPWSWTSSNYKNAAHLNPLLEHISAGRAFRCLQSTIFCISVNLRYAPRCPCSDWVHFPRNPLKISCCCGRKCTTLIFVDLLFSPIKAWYDMKFIKSSYAVLGTRTAILLSVYCVIYPRKFAVSTPLVL